jgi:mono/diheme cytochrome c family protein
LPDASPARLALLLGLLLAGALLLTACSSGSGSIASTGFSPADAAETPLPLPELDPDLVAQGEGIYRQYCAACHGAQGEGQPNWKQPLADGSYPAPPHNADGHTWHHGDGTLFKYIKEGGAGLNIPNFKSNMPGFGDTLSDEEIVAVITYLKSLWPEEQRRSQYQATLQDPLP